MAELMKNKGAQVNGSGSIPSTVKVQFSLTATNMDNSTVLAIQEPLEPIPSFNNSSDHTALNCMDDNMPGQSGPLDSAIAQSGRLGSTPDQTDRD
ncbi:hypothetical protein EB796_017974 [Bugula neritina]|uniref:Uncharacterized protein n=1 Tax=Bugula neritina TaxID=10212 RepID=A0A7J7JEA1_BUGNE|nr:hypothetical protein EB796_017974 [Bugula neritina]